MAKSVLYLVPSSGYGGVETFLTHTAKFHDRTRYQPHFCVFREGPLFEILSSHAPNAVSRANSTPRLGRPASFARTVNWLRREIRETNASLVHSTMAYGALFGSIAAKLENVPHVWFQHGPVSGWMDRIAGWLPAETIIVNSKHTLHLQEKLHTRRHFELIFPGVDIAKMTEAPGSPTRTQWGLTEDDFAVGLFCRFQKWKGPELFIEAIARARKMQPKMKIRGLIFGAGDADYEKRLRAWNDSLGKSVTFMGPVRGASSIMSALNAVVNASLTPEPFGLTLIEAMAAGAVAIAPREGGPLEIIDDKKTGLLFEPRNAQDLAKTIVRLATSPEKQERLRHDALNCAREKFEASKTIKALEKCYDEIMAKNS